MPPGSSGAVGIAVVGSRDTWPAAMAAVLDSWLISFLRLICQRSTATLVFAVMSHTVPKVRLVARSGSRLGLGEVMMATLAAVQPSAPFVAAQRAGSAAVVKAARPPR